MRLPPFTIFLFMVWLRSGPDNIERAESFNNLLLFQEPSQTKGEEPTKKTGNDQNKICFFTVLGPVKPRNPCRVRSLATGQEPLFLFLQDMELT
jgi:hypothetical protein